MNKFTGAWFIILSLFALSAFTTLNDSTGPHGGQLNCNRDFCVEMSACYDYFELYVYTRSLKPILNRNIKGAVVYYYKDKKAVTEELHAWGVDGLVAKGVTGFEYCDANLTVNGRPLLVRFSNSFVCTPQ